MTSRTQRGPERFALELKRRGIDARVQHLPDSTRTAAEAAAAIGCRVSEIAKSVIFRDLDQDRPLLVVASGTNRVSKSRLEALAGCRVGRADADFVRRTTGYAIGGVPPFGHQQPLTTFIDEDLFAFEQVWAAAGGSFDVFAVSPPDLLDASGGQRVEIAE